MSECGEKDSKTLMEHDAETGTPWMEMNRMKIKKKRMGLETLSETGTFEGSGRFWVKTRLIEIVERVY